MNLEEQIVASKEITKSLKKYQRLVEKKTKKPKAEVPATTGAEGVVPVPTESIATVSTEVKT